VAGACCVVVLYQIALYWVPGVLVLLTACSLLPLLSIAIGAVGAWYRSWWVTLAGTFAMNVALYEGGVIESAVFPYTHVRPVVPPASEVPFFIVGLLGTGLVAALSHYLADHRMALRSTPPPHCGVCGYSLAGLQISRCPECGTPFPAHLLDGTAASEDKGPGDQPR
jgi:hypothetical protein